MRTVMVLSPRSETTMPWRSRRRPVGPCSGAGVVSSRGPPARRFSRELLRQRRRSAAFLARSAARSAVRSSTERWGLASLCSERSRRRRSFGESCSSSAGAAPEGPGSAGAEPAGSAPSAALASSGVSSSLFSGSSSIALLPDLGFNVQAPLARHGQAARQVLLGLLEAGRVLQLTGRVLEAQVERLLATVVDEASEAGVVEAVYLNRLGH